jgi:hypothetical protein
VDEERWRTKPAGETTAGNVLGDAGAEAVPLGATAPTGPAGEELRRTHPTGDIGDQALGRCRWGRRRRGVRSEEVDSDPIAFVALEPFLN